MRDAFAVTDAFTRIGRSDIGRDLKYRSNANLFFTVRLRSDCGWFKFGMPLCRSGSWMQKSTPGIKVTDADQHAFSRVLASVTQGVLRADATCRRVARFRSL